MNWCCVPWFGFSIWIFRGNKRFRGIACFAIRPRATEASRDTREERFVIIIIGESISPSGKGGYSKTRKDTFHNVTCQNVYARQMKSYLPLQRGAFWQFRHHHVEAHALRNIRIALFFDAHLLSQDPFPFSLSNSHRWGLRHVTDPAEKEKLETVIIALDKLSSR